MNDIVVQAFVTLDGVVQSVGGPDEDRDGGFDLGGWQGDRDLGDLVLDWESRTEALLLGRRTYEIWSSYWPFADQSDATPFGDLARRYNRVPKRVASRTLSDLTWQGAELLGPDLPAAVAALRSELSAAGTSPEGEIRLWGSTGLIKSLAEHDLVDEYRLVVYPIVLGRGKRLFAEGFPTSTLAQVSSEALPSGVTVSTYRRGGA
ncbi:hypothetical protein AX769_03305 [Frondihabitans sp. PAMC 28766]|uniref:dihydrofolate reductase family protein n=1 Tax=Frondihabitans sp. PAMC 28766 TaxID=1795630 RepID=UPI00078D16C2|nr:dihydrofolate reductase family protein [Frondihabitans sp. PAMC 28766]AMM19336.1 hypothetical protein AX769_03305 [Frondihabitans sp. PAMC 28766]